MLRDTREDGALTSRDLEPVHIPGSIQPHGSMLVADELDQHRGALAGGGRCGEGQTGKSRRKWLWVQDAPDEESNDPGLRVTLTAPIHRGT